MKPCAPCFMPQSATAQLVAFASSFGRHSEEPHVVVMRAARTTKNSTGHSRRFLVVYFLVTIRNFLTKQGRILEFRALCREGCWASWRHCTMVSSDTKPHRKKSCCGCHVPWLSLYVSRLRLFHGPAGPSAPRSAPLTYMWAPALRTCPATCVSLTRPLRGPIPVFRVAL